MPSPLRIRFRKTASGPEFGPFEPGHETVLPYARARDLIDSGSAESLGSVGPDPDLMPEAEKPPVRVERAVRRAQEAAVALPQRENLAVDRRGVLPAGDSKVRNLSGTSESVSKPADPKSDSPASGKK